MHLLTTLAVDSLSRTEHYYRELLGLPTEWLQLAAEPRAALLITGESGQLLFQESTRLLARHPTALAGLERHPRGVGVMLEFTVRDLCPVLQRLERAQLTTVYELEDGENRRREVWVRDPDGYLLILNQEETRL